MKRGETPALENCGLIWRLQPSTLTVSTSPTGESKTRNLTQPQFLRHPIPWLRNLAIDNLWPQINFHLRTTPHAVFYCNFESCASAAPQCLLSRAAHFHMWCLCARPYVCVETLTPFWHDRHGVEPIWMHKMSTSNANWPRARRGSWFALRARPLAPPWNF